jgi:hypothetical protein
MTGSQLRSCNIKAILWAAVLPCNFDLVDFETENLISMPLHIVRAALLKNAASSLSAAVLRESPGGFHSDFLTL